MGWRRVSPPNNLGGMDTERPRRRRFAITLRALLVLVLVVGLGLGWPIARARRQRAAIAAIEAAGGRIYFDWQMAYDPVTNASIGPRGPAWLRRLVGDDLFQRVHFAFVDAAVSSHLRDLPGLTGLIVYDSLTDEHLADIGQVTSLRTLEFIASQGMTDAGLVELADLRSLSGLVIDDMTISDATMSQLAAFTALESLDLKNCPCQISDRGLARLGALPKLKEVSIGDCSGVTPGGLRQLMRGRPGLRVSVGGNGPLRPGPQ
jgi:hypothetical protein